MNTLNAKKCRYVMFLVSQDRRTVVYIVIAEMG